MLQIVVAQVCGKTLVVGPVLVVPEADATMTKLEMNLLSVGVFQTIEKVQGNGPQNERKSLFCSEALSWFVGAVFLKVT